MTILITLDCVRADHVGGELTPRLNAMAPEWTTFTQAFSQSQNTLSSHLTMLTSNYLFQHGVYSNFVNKALPPHALPNRLAGLGWETRAFTSVDFLAQLLGNKVGAADRRFPGAEESGLVARLTRRLYGRRATAEKTLDRGFAWLASPKRREKAFLWLHLFDAHMVYEAPARFLAEHVVEGRAQRPLREELAARGWFSPDFPEYGEALPVGHFPQRYRAAVAYQDACLHAFFERLKAKGLWADSLVLITADHGECLEGDHAVYCAHKKLFDTTVHVPLLVKFPRGKHAGTRVDALVQHVDLAPTVLAAAGSEEPLYMGTSLAAVAAEGEGPHGVVFAEHVNNFMRSARDKEYIFAETVPGADNRWGLAVEEETLFHRDGNPAPEGAAAHGERLRGALHDLLASRPEVREAWGEASEADDRVAERLRELGYM